MIAEAYVETDKAAKYLKWLCGHFKIKVPAEYDEERGTVLFPFGVCEMRVQPGTLYIRVNTTDPDSFERLKEVVGDHLERFGRKDMLQITWVDQD